jgi:hypothetical protein
VEAQRLPGRRAGVGLGDVADLDHPLEHLVAAGERRLRVVDRVVRRRVLHQPGQQRRLRQREL